jgi:hypothetical protein
MLSPLGRGQAEVSRLALAIFRLLNGPENRSLGSVSIPSQYLDLEFGIVGGALTTKGQAEKRGSNCRPDIEALSK